MKFDVVIGNPPYQDDTKGNNRSGPIYHTFMEEAYKISLKSCLITPARFLFNIGQTPSHWNVKMVNDPYLNVVKYFTNSDEVFPNTDIKGGVVITFRDSAKIIGPIGTFTTFRELNSILNKVDKLSSSNLGDIHYGNSTYKWSEQFQKEKQSLLQRLPNGSRRHLTSRVFSVLPEIFKNNSNDVIGDFIKIYGREDNSRTYKYVQRAFIDSHPNLDKFKVFVPGANGSGAIGEVLSTPVIGTPGTGMTETFISFGNFDDLLQAENLLKYIKSKFARVMLGILKITQNNKTKYVWSKVPMQDFTLNSDIDWSKPIPDIDQQLYNKYNLTEEEINFIETNVKEME